MSEADLPLDKDFGENERLLHYTSSQGLFGILDSGCLWATHFKFLNDSKEFFAAQKSLTDFVELEIRKKIAALKVTNKIDIASSALRDASAEEARIIVDAFCRTTLKLASPFIFSSFISDSGRVGYRNGELLHWALYGRNGGYALQINPHKLLVLINKHAERYDTGLLSQRAVYVENDVPRELKADYAVLGEVARNMVVARIEDKIEQVDAGRAAPPFMRIASIIKDNYFSLEQEARLVALRFNESHKKGNEKVFIRHGAGSAIPYVKLFEGELLSETCPIEAIIVGPHPDRDRRREALEIFLRARGLQGIEIVQSEVPYIGS